MGQTSTAKQNRIFGIFSMLFGAIGWFASWELATEYIKKLKDPAYIPNCEISPLVTCGPNMDSWQGSVFGFSNTFIGLTCFVAPIIIGAALLAGAKFNRLFWWLYLTGLTFGISFIFWLSVQSVFVLGTLCPWCMVVWLVMIPLFWVSLGKMLRAGWLGINGDSSFARFMHSWSWVFVIACYALIATYAQIGVNWIGTIF